MTIRPMTLKELAVAYGVSRSTMRRWLLRHAATIGPRGSGRQTFSTSQVALIFRLLDVPEAKNPD